MELFNNSRKIKESLTRVFHHSLVLDARLMEARFIFFSDHHRGTRGISDYFQRNEKIYNAALGYYLERGFHLILLGDVEELWEFSPGAVLKSYPHSYRLESEFYRSGRFTRLPGNHDNVWRNPKYLKLHMNKFFPGLQTPDSVRIQLQNESGSLEAQLLLTHGHHGTLLNDKFYWFGRFWMRYVQKGILWLLKRPYQTPAHNYSLREELESVFFEWVNKKNHNSSTRTILITGHTHHPIFMSPGSIHRMEKGVAMLKSSQVKKNQKRAARLRANLEYLKTDLGNDFSEDRSFYFNTGCCSYLDGSITGIEINRGKIKLVKWVDESNRADRIVLGSEKIREI